MKPFVYEGRIRIFDPEPGDVIYLLDHPDAEEFFSPPLLAAPFLQRVEGMMFGDIPGRFRITIEELPSPRPTCSVCGEEVDGDITWCFAGDERVPAHAVPPTLEVAE